MKAYVKITEYVVSIQEILITMILGMVFKLTESWQSLFPCSIFHLIVSLRSLSCPVRPRKCFLLPRV